MELSQGKIDDIDISFGVNVSTHYYDNEPVGKTQYYIMALDSGHGTITMEQFNKRFLQIKGEALEEVLRAKNSKKDPIVALSNIQEIKEWLKEISSMLIKEKNVGEVVIKLRHPALH